jgi:hypothetical protein
VDGNQKLRIKVGEHEFEAEGPPEAVQAQFEMFKQLLTASAAILQPRPIAAAAESAADEAAEIQTPGNGAKREAGAVDTDLHKIMRVDGRIVSFTVPPATADAALLLLLYGQKILRQNDGVTGNEVISGLTTTGGLGINRPDRMLARAATSGDVIVIGEGRSKRYRLTNTGLAKARQLAAELIAKVA